MSDLQTRIGQYDELLRRFASGVRAAQLYAPDHPLVGRNVEGLLTVLAALHTAQSSIAIGIVGSQLVVADTPMSRASLGMAELIKRLKDHEIERVAFDRGVTQQELSPFILALASLGKADTPGADWKFAHISVGRITADDRRTDGIGSDMAAIRQLYAGAVSAAQTVWESAERDGEPDLPAALQAIEGLADAVTHNRTALVALTAMRSYDNYTFTHMVNVSILTMGQARALGIDGQLLRELGLSALMHDIGKVRTPKDILNKPDKLTDPEFEIMRRHTVDGAEILRRTPEMPILAPVVAFEHHLRQDGTGYPARLPEGVSDGPHPVRAEAQRRHPVRPASGPPLRPAAGHLPPGQPRAADDRRDRRGDRGPRTRSAPAARPRAVRERRHPARSPIRPQPLGASASRGGRALDRRPGGPGGLRHRSAGSSADEIDRGLRPPVPLARLCRRPGRPISSYTLRA